MSTIELPFVGALREALKSTKPLIQVVLGPRQVGKTTGVGQLLKEYDKKDFVFASADGEISRPSRWIDECWEDAVSHGASLLVIDEIQKVEGWSERVKLLWDRQAEAGKFLKLVILGSSSLRLQQGLSESLAGRYQPHRVYHWNPPESLAAYGVSFDEYLIFGGYPGSYRFINDRQQWLAYVRESIVDAVIGRDILSLVRVKSPALFRQCFQIASAYAAQEISYTKLLGQLQDRGNTDLVKSYLEHFEGAYLLRQVFKYSNKATLRRSSSPKIVPMCPALYAVERDADLSPSELGRSFELTVGAALARLPGHLYYWRQGRHEVDYVYQYGRDLVAIEVKLVRTQPAKGLAAFTEAFPHAKPLVLTRENVAPLFSGRLPGG